MKENVENIKVGRDYTPSMSTQDINVQNMPKTISRNTPHARFMAIYNINTWLSCRICLPYTLSTFEGWILQELFTL